jgi:DNA-binding protein HU-beta
MKKIELVEKVAEEAGLTKADATRAIDATINAITAALVKGDKVPVVGFGTFAVSTRAAREGRNPRTGETVKIAARKAVTFKAGSALKDAVNK